MLSKEENELLARVGPGTPTGEMMRRYWHPILPEIKLDENPVQNVKILGEELVLYRDRQNRLGLIGPRCPHRAVHMQFGIPEPEGIRCPYHGWMYDNTGQCIEQPLEPADSGFKDKITLKAYPAQSLGGLVWAYLGPDPAPMLPRWTPLVKEGQYRQIEMVTLPCNWLQVMENRADIGHAIYLHGRFMQYALERLDQKQMRHEIGMWREHEERMNRGAHPIYTPLWHEWGFAKQAHDSDREPQDTEYTVNPIVFPYSVLGGPVKRGKITQTLSMGVPVDDTTTWLVDYAVYSFPPEIGEPAQEKVPYIDTPLEGLDGKFDLHDIRAQDLVAWWSQGDITDRSEEHLGLSDELVIEYRTLLRRQIREVQEGGEPVGVFHDASSAERPDRRIPGLYEDAEDSTLAAKPVRVENLTFVDYRDVLEHHRFADKALLERLYQKTAELTQRETFR